MAILPWVSSPMDLKNTLSEGQQPPTTADMAKSRNLPLQEGIGPPMHTPEPNDIEINMIIQKFQEEPPHFFSDKSRGRRGASWVNPRKHGGGATHLKAGVHNFWDLERRRDISGYVFMVDGGAMISWSSKKQELVTLSTAEVEYGAAKGGDVAMHIVWRGFQGYQQANYTFWGQPISNCTGTWRKLPCTHQAHQYLLPLHLLSVYHRGRLYQTYLLPNRWTNSRYTHQSLAKHKGKAFCNSHGPLPALTKNRETGVSGIKCRGMPLKVFSRIDLLIYR